MENKKTYTEDHVLAMLEEIKGQNNIVIEQYTSLTEKVDLILEDVDELKSNMVDVKSDIKEMKSDIVDIKTELKVKAGKEITDDHENRIVKLEKATLVTG